MIQNFKLEILLLILSLVALICSLLKLPKKKIVFVANISLVVLMAWMYLSSTLRLDLREYFKLIILASAFVANYFWLLSSSKTDDQYPALVLFSALGGLLVAGAGDFLTLFLGLELQSLTSYILSSLYLTSLRSSEAGLKYFLLGAISTCLMLFGISFIYGSSATLDYNHLIYVYDFDYIAKFGVILVVISLVFKLGAAPLHIWLPDVYQGSPVASMHAFISINKFSALAGLVFFATIFTHAKDVDFLIKQLFVIASFSSLAIGAFGALRQTNFKRFLAYSGIFDIGFILALFSIGYGFISILYLLIYTITIWLVLDILVSLKIDIDELEISDFAGLIKLDMCSGVILSIAFFSLLGAPPLLGFVAKFVVLLMLMWHKSYCLTLFATFMSLVSAYYYLRIIKNITLDQGSQLKQALLPAISSRAVALMLVVILLMWPVALIL